jgi:hypothetical protein
MMKIVKIIQNNYLKHALALNWNKMFGNFKYFSSNSKRDKTSLDKKVILKLIIHKIISKQSQSLDHDTQFEFAL